MNTVSVRLCSTKQFSQINYEWRGPLNHFFFIRDNDIHCIRVFKNYSNWWNFVFNIFIVMYKSNKILF